MNTKSNLSLIIGLGAVWGLLEATLGWGLHLLHVPFKSLLLFPIGLFLMLSGINQTGKKQAAIQIATVAALIKLTNLLIPGAFPAYYVINPAVAIWLEGLAVFAFSHYSRMNPETKLPLQIIWQWLMATGLVVLSQLVFAGWQVTVSELSVANPVVERLFGAQNILPFFLHSFLKGGLLAGIAWLLRSGEKRSGWLRLNWAWSVSLVVLALVVDYVTL